MRDNATLGATSEDQKWVALAATRDSGTMRRAKPSRESRLMANRQCVPPRRTARNESRNFCSFAALVHICTIEVEECTQKLATLVSS